MIWTTWKELPMHEKSRVYELLGGVAKTSRCRPTTLYRIWYVWCCADHGTDYGPHAARWKAGGQYEYLSSHGICKRFGIYKPPIPHADRDLHKRKPGPRRKVRRVSCYHSEMTFRGRGEE